MTTRKNLLDVTGKVFHKYIYPMTEKEFSSAKKFDEYHKILNAKFILNEDQWGEVLMEWDKKEIMKTINDFNFKVEDGRMITNQVEDLIAFIEENAIEKIGFGQDVHSEEGTPTVVVYRMSEKNHVEYGSMCEAITVYYNSNEIFLTDDFVYAVDLEENERGKGFRF